MNITWPAFFRVIAEKRPTLLIHEADTVLDGKKVLNNENDLLVRLKKNPGKLAMAARIRNETTLLLKRIAARLQLRTAKSARAIFHQWMQHHEKSPPKPSPCAQLQFQPLGDPFLRESLRSSSTLVLDIFC